MTNHNIAISQVLDQIETTEQEKARLYLDGKGCIVSGDFRRESISSLRHLLKKPLGFFLCLSWRRIALVALSIFTANAAMIMLLAYTNRCYYLQRSVCSKLSAMITIWRRKYSHPRL